MFEHILRFKIPVFTDSIDGVLIFNYIFNRYMLANYYCTIQNNFRVTISINVLVTPLSNIIVQTINFHRHKKLMLYTIAIEFIFVLKKFILEIKNPLKKQYISNFIDISTLPIYVRYPTIWALQEPKLTINESSSTGISGIDL